jgi:hypothetical protein
MRREGYRVSTIRAAVKALRAVGQRCDLLDVIAFKEHMARVDYDDNRKDRVLDDARRIQASWAAGDLHKNSLLRSSSSLLDSLSHCP